MPEPKKNKVGRPKGEPTKMLAFRINKSKANQFLKIHNSKIRKMVFNLWIDGMIEEYEHYLKNTNNVT